MQKKTICLKVYLFSFIFLLSLFAGLLFVLSPHSSPVAHASSLSTSYKLSDMTEEECIDFIEENNIVIPNGFVDVGSFVHDVIQAVEDEPNLEFTFNYYVTLEFAENIKALVNNYYGVTQDKTVSSISYTAGYELQYNWVQNDNGDWVSIGGAWNSDWVYYNCYAYAIDKPQNFPSPTIYFPHQPGYFGGTGAFDLDEKKCSIYDLALIVKDDLISLGYDVSIYNKEPELVFPSQRLICVRRGSRDYHFMYKNFSDGYWYHKPGQTAPLKYKFSPDQYVWESESSYRGVESFGGTIYDSDIYYIVYGESPFTTTISNNTCTITGIKSGTALTGSLTIPENINGKTVTRIENSAFSNYTALTSVTIPANVTSIGNQAFYGCKKLEKVVIKNPGGVVTLGSLAFSGTSSDLKIYVPENLYSTYKTATNWSSYASALDKWYKDSTGSYLFEYVKFPADSAFLNLYLLSSNSGNGNLIENSTGVVGGGYYTFCYIRFDLMSEFYDFTAPQENDCVMYIWLGTSANGLKYDIYNQHEQYSMSSTVQDGILYVPLMDYFDWLVCRLYVEPGANNKEMIYFDLSDIEIGLIIINYI